MGDKLTRLGSPMIDRVAFVPAGDNPEAHVTLVKLKRPAPKADPTSTDVHIDQPLGGKKPKKPKKPFPPETTKGFRILVDKRWVFIEKEDESAESLTDEIDEIRGAWRSQYSNPFGGDSGWVVDIYRDHVIVELNGENYSVDYSTDADGDIHFDMTSVVEVQQTWTPSGESGVKAGGREEGHMTTAPPKVERPSDLSDKDAVEKYLDALEKERTEAAEAQEKADQDRDEKIAALEKQLAAPKGNEPTDPFEKAMADPDVPESLKTVMRSDRERAEKAEKENAETKSAFDKAEEARAIEKAEAVAATFKTVEKDPKVLGPILHRIETGKTTPEDRTAIEETLKRAEELGRRALKAIGDPSVTAEATEALSAWDTHIKALMSADANLSREGAVAKALHSKEGRELQKAVREEEAEVES